MEKLLAFMICFGFISCTKSVDKKKTVSKVDSKVFELSVENTFPFSKAEKVELISYNFGDYRALDANYELVDGKLPFDKSIIKEHVLLDKVQQYKLLQILTTDKCPKEYAVADCYNPEHRITFYDKENKIIGYLEVCIQCTGSRISKGFTTVPLCDLKMKELKQFFISAGIKHFSEF